MQLSEIELNEPGTCSQSKAFFCEVFLIGFASLPHQKIENWLFILLFVAENHLRFWTWA